jgi:hypothetical protein
VQYERSLSSSFCAIPGPAINSRTVSSFTNAIEPYEFARVVVSDGTLLEGLVGLVPRVSCCVWGSMEPVTFLYIWYPFVFLSFALSTISPIHDKKSGFAHATSGVAVGGMSRWFPERHHAVREEKERSTRWPGNLDFQTWDCIFTVRNSPIQ